MLSVECPPKKFCKAIRKTIRKGRLDFLMQELERITPSGWETVCLDEKPLPLCCAWYIEVDGPNGEELFIVFRMKSDRQMAEEAMAFKAANKRKKDERPDQHSYWS